jgi:6-phosphogluconolactonase (cycloisomerase 2 family)
VSTAAASAASASAGNHHDAHVPTVYTETNAAAGNAVLAFHKINGVLTNVGTFATGGLGSGDGLGSQGAVVADGEHLLAVDAGSNQVSLFSINDDGGLTLDDIESSAGTRPVSVTVRGHVAYVVNVTSRTVSGFRIDGDQLTPIVGSTRALPGDGAAQVSLDASGTRLVVTEKATNTIDVLPIGKGGAAGPAVSHVSTGVTPFGFAIDRRNNVIVSNANGGAPGASSLSSYQLTGSTGLAAVSSVVATTQTAACWVALSENQKFAYTANAGSGTISSYTVARNGALTLLQPVAATPGAGAVDVAVVDGTLFALANGPHAISAYGVGTEGSLTAAGSVAIPAGVAGLAAS